MSAPRVVVQADRKALHPISVSAPRTAWKLFGWLGLIFVVIGAVDLALHWYPTAFKQPEWEFGTVANSVATLPLMTIGLTIMLASFLARGSRVGVMVMCVVFVLVLLFLIAAYLLFLSDVPLALRAAQGPVAITIKKSIVRTSAMALAFGIGYGAAAVLSFRYLLRRVSDG
jgi:hypothetical protein